MVSDDDLTPVPPPSSADHRALVDALEGMAKHFLEERFGKLFTRIDEQLFDLANNAPSQHDQLHYFDTMRMLRLHRDSLGQDMLDACTLIFSDIGRARHVAEKAAEATADMDGLSLELVKNDVLEEMITLDNMVSRVIDRSQPELDLLTRRLGYVVGGNFTDNNNPFVPEYLCERFATSTGLLKLDFEPRLVILKLLDKVLLRDWPTLVRKSNDFLRESGVLVDLEKRRPPIKKKEDQLLPAAQQSPADAPAVSLTAGSRDSQSYGPVGHDVSAGIASTRSDLADESHRVSEPARSGGGSRFADPEHIYGDVLAGLHRLLHEQGRSERKARGEYPDQQRPQSFYLGADELAGILASWRSDAESGALLETLAKEGLEQAIVGILAKNDHSLDSLKEIDQTILRLLDKTFGRLNGQQLNPPGLHELVLKLELPATWLALKDPLFLERQNHPGRRLINELCKASSTLQGEESGSVDGLQRKIDEIIDRLNEFEVTVRELTGLLAEFIDFVEKDKRFQTIREQRVLEEEEAQARLADANGQVVQILTDRLVNRRWPGFLVNFFEHAWSRVLFLACLRHGNNSEEWRDALGLLDRLLVLVSARLSPGEVELAGLMADIEEKLNHVGYDRGDCQRHLESFRAYFASLSETRSEVADHPPLASLSLQLPGQQPHMDVAPENLDVAMLDAVDTLKKGTWVEFRDDETGTTLRCKLAGAINASSKLVFTNRRGAKVAQEYRHRMAIKMQQGKVIVLDNSHLFDQAYDQVIAEIQAEIRERSAGM